MLTPRSHMQWLGTSLAAAASVQSQLIRSAFSVGLCSHDAGSCGLNLASGEVRKSAQSLLVTAVKNLASVSVSSAPNRSRARRTNGGSLENTRASFSLGGVVAEASAGASDLLPVPAAGVCSR